MLPASSRRLTARALLLAGALFAGGAFAGPAAATSLQQALARAYENNPVLTAARAGQRANDENEVIARSNALPTVSATGAYREDLVISGNSLTAPQRLVNLSGRVSVPIYQGGAIRAAAAAAKARVDAGEADLRGTEASIFSAVVGAYMDVLRDSAIVELNRKNVAVLATNLRASQDRFEIGDLTRTDVAQSDARLALAQGQLQGAEANLIAAQEAYIRLVGDAPTDLTPPPPLPGLPAAADDAVTVALADNPDLAAATRLIAASRQDITVAKASRLPQVNGNVDAGYTNFLGTLGSNIPGTNFAQTDRSVQATIGVSVPLFQGGRPAARVRQAQARTSQALENYIAVERGVIAQTRAAHAAWQASENVIRATNQAVAASALSLEGVRAENSVGTRTILDILNAEQENLNAQVQLVTAQRNSYVAAFSLLAAMGRAEARHLGLGGDTLYDPGANRRRVAGQIWDWADDVAPRQISTDTRAVASPGPR